MKKAKIKPEDYGYFVSCICRNIPNEQIVEEFGVSYKTTMTYKSYAKAVASGNRDLGLKIYKNLNKGIVEKIDEYIDTGMLTNLAYKSKKKIGPEQTGPKPRIHAKQTLEELKTKPTVQIVPKFDLNAGAINTLPTPKQPEPAKEDVPVKEIVGLLQSTLESIQTLLEKL